MSASECDRREQLHLLAAEGGRLARDDESFLQEHLSRCDDCRLEDEATAALRLRDEDPGHFAIDEVSRARAIEQVLAQVDATPVALEANQPSRLRPWAAAVAACLVVVGAGVVGARLLRGYSGHVLLAAGEARSDSGRLELGQRVAEGQILETQDGEATVALPSGITFGLDAHSRLTVARLSEEAIELELADGAMTASVDPHRQGPRFGVRTRSGRVEIKGTVFSLTDQEESVELRVLRGTVAVLEGGTAPRQVTALQGARLGSGTTRALTKAEQGELLAASRRLAIVQGDDGVAVQIESRPSGARVRFNGELIGHTPLSAKILPGSYDLEISATSVEGLVLVRERVELEAGDALERRYTLEVENDKKKPRR